MEKPRSWDKHGCILTEVRYAVMAESSTSATVEATQIYVNTSECEVAEAVFRFPCDAGACGVIGLEACVDGVTVPGHVVDRDTAEDKYDDGIAWNRVTASASAPPAATERFDYVIVRVGNILPGAQVTVRLLLTALLFRNPIFPGKPYRFLCIPLALLPTPYSAEDTVQDPDMLYHEKRCLREEAEANGPAPRPTAPYTVAVSILPPAPTCRPVLESVTSLAHDVPEVGDLVTCSPDRDLVLCFVFSSDPQHQADKPRVLAAPASSSCRYRYLTAAPLRSVAPPAPPRRPSTTRAALLLLDASQGMQGPAMLAAQAATKGLLNAMAACVHTEWRVRIVRVYSEQRQEYSAGILRASGVGEATAFVNRTTAEKGRRGGSTGIAGELMGAGPEEEVFVFSNGCIGFGRGDVVIAACRAVAVAVGPATDLPRLRRLIRSARRKSLAYYPVLLGGTKQRLEQDMQGLLDDTEDEVNAEIGPEQEEVGVVAVPRDPSALYQVSEVLYSGEGWERRAFTPVDEEESDDDGTRFGFASAVLKAAAWRVVRLLERCGAAKPVVLTASLAGGVGSSAAAFVASADHSVSVGTAAHVLRTVPHPKPVFWCFAPRRAANPAIKPSAAQAAAVPRFAGAERKKKVAAKKKLGPLMNVVEKLVRLTTRGQEARPVPPPHKKAAAPKAKRKRISSQENNEEVRRLEAEQEEEDEEEDERIMEEEAVPRMERLRLRQHRPDETSLPQLLPKLPENLQRGLQRVAVRCGLVKAHQLLQGTTAVSELAKLQDEHRLVPCSASVAALLASIVPEHSWAALRAAGPPTTEDTEGEKDPDAADALCITAFLAATGSTSAASAVRSSLPPPHAHLLLQITTILLTHASNLAAHLT